MQADAIEAARTKWMPANADEWKALTATIATHRGIDRLPRANVRRKYDAGLTALAIPLLFLVHLFTREVTPDDHAAAPAPSRPSPAESAPDDPRLREWDAGASISTSSSAAVRRDCPVSDPRR